MKTGPYTLHNFKNIITGFENKTLSGIIPEEEPAIIYLKGNGEEYLVGTNTQLYIIKKGLYLGQPKGKGYFQINYSKISSVQMYRIQFGCSILHISGAGLPQAGKDVMYKYDLDFKDKLNVIVLKKNQVKDFQEATEIIMGKVAESKRTVKGKSQNNYVADELIKLKSLMDQGILTKEEFESLKRKLLS